MIHPQEVEPANRALARAGIGWGDLAAVELNEAFAGQALARLQSWPELDPEIVNVRGGAIAIGHPLGASGVRILGTLARELQSRGGGWGLAAICIGVGQGLAVVVEALDPAGHLASVERAEAVNALIAGHLLGTVDALA